MKNKISFKGFQEVGTGGGCTAMEFTLAHTYNVMVTDDGEVPKGHLATIILEVRGAYAIGAHLDFKKHTVELIEETEEALIDLTLQKDGCVMSFRHDGITVAVEVLIDWKHSTLEILA